MFYTGPLVLKSALPYDNYVNFLSLYIATLILACPKYHNDNCLNYSQDLYKYFVDTFIILYGKSNASHNVHNMLHIVSDVRNMGALDQFSAFPFENTLQQLKSLVRKGDKPLSQIVKRIQESNNSITSENNKKCQNQKYKEHNKGPLLPGTNCPQFKQIHFENYSLQIEEPNNCCYLKKWKYHIN